MHKVGLLLLPLLLFACSDDSTPPPRDSAPISDSQDIPDAALADSAPSDTTAADGPTGDAATKTACGMSGLECERATQVCVAKGPIGPSVNYSCEAVPSGCESDRSCSCLATHLCNQGDMCSSSADNRIFCDNGTQ